eukprot:TRINITY_DN3352_c0_g1_i1.p1 TRINITY_DN3352_c0_g1~~TRINITY_DN3352_c0_g1_i1.p1  ORF type:complete len:797 (+),score=229.90 TRINITY_DN3352_c0_g1_i1:28-2391(+)
MGLAACKDCGVGDSDAKKEKDSVSSDAAPVENKDAENLKFLREVKLFKRLPADSHPQLARACQAVDFKPRQTIIKQGEDGEEFFIIKSGEADVEVSGKKVASLKSSDYFGENALLRNEPRTATITAKTELKALKITRDQFDKLGLREKLEFPQRKAVGGGKVKTDAMAKAPTPKIAEERKLMAEALKKNENLQGIVSLDDNRTNQMIDVAWKETVKTGTKVITEGDLNADFFYIVQEGSFEIQVTVEEHHSAEEAEAVVNIVGTVGKGGSFGELALLYFAPRAATVLAKEESIVWVIDRKNFKDILAKSSDEIAKEYVKYLEKVELLSPLKDDEKEAVAQTLNEMSFTKGEMVFQQGEKGDVFYILIAGQVTVIKDGKETAKLNATPDKASFFGEKALLNNEPRTATLQVTSETAKALTLDRQSFDMLLGPLEDLKKRGKEGGQSKLEEMKSGTSVAESNGRKFGLIARKDLKRIGLLGCGGFGAVELVEHTSTNETYALKALSKGYIVKSGMQNSVISEKNVQLMCDSPFIIKLFETFNGTQSLYFLLELALGGELYATYNKKGFFGKEAHAKFYVAGVINAFDHFHSKKIIYRDLKPENLLLNEHGHMKITDMGLAKVVIGKTYTTCGTPDYFAPELIASSGHTVAVDWWTLGILTFELMGGHPPFESAYPMQIYQKVTKGINKVAFPPKCKGVVEDFIKGLCKKEPSERLAMKKGGAGNLRKHNWFKGFDWERYDKGDSPAPYKPQVKSKKDVANFSARKEDMPPTVQYKDDGSGWDKDFATCT